LFSASPAVELAIQSCGFISNFKGATVSDPSQIQPPPLQPASSGLSDNAAGALAYVTIIPAIIFLIVEPFNKNSYVRFHSWQSIFFGIAAFAINLVLTAIPVIGWILIPFVGLAFLIIWVILLLKALKGERFMLPLIGKFAAQQAGA
jgi:uncharacterized membrane protein